MLMVDSSAFLSSEAWQLPIRDCFQSMMQAYFQKMIQTWLSVEVSSMAISIAEAVIERDISEDEHRALIDSFIDEMGDKE